jgi:hypothetical protein
MDALGIELPSWEEGRRSCFALCNVSPLILGSAMVGSGTSNTWKRNNDRFKPAFLFFPCGMFRHSK